MQLDPSHPHQPAYLPPATPSMPQPLRGEAAAAALPPPADVNARSLQLQLRDIIGNDDRQRIADTRVVPWRLVCHLVIEDMQGRAVTGTGWLAGPSTVFTAGHNLLYRSGGHQARRVWVVPGRDGGTAPFGTVQASAFDTHPQWQQSGRAEWDAGVVWLPQPLGSTLGYFGFAAQPDSVLHGLGVQTAGYPDDKPAGTAWAAASTIHREMPQMLAYGLDTWPGQSGSPVFAFDAQQRPVALAIHVYGNTSENLGVRISPSLLQTLQGWWR